MSPQMELISLIVSIIGVVISIAALVVAIWALFDVRKHVKDLLNLEYRRSYAKVLNDMAWMFLESTDKGYPKDIAKGLEDFSLLSHSLDPEKDEETPKLTVEREALVMAEKLVQVGAAKWQPDFDLEKVKKALREWQNQKNKVRLLRVLGELDKFS